MSFLKPVTGFAAFAALAGCSGELAGDVVFDDLITGPAAPGVEIQFVPDEIDIGSGITKTVTSSAAGRYDVSLKSGRYTIEFTDPSFDHCPGGTAPDGNAYVVVQPLVSGTAHICIDP